MMQSTFYGNEGGSTSLSKNHLAHSIDMDNLQHLRSTREIDVAHYHGPCTTLHCDLEEEHLQHTSVRGFSSLKML